MDATKLATHSYELSGKVAQLLQKRIEFAQKHYRERVTEARAKFAAQVAAIRNQLEATPPTP